MGTTMTTADVAYIRANYAPLEELCATRRETAADIRALIGTRLLPRASYVLPDETEMFPRDFFALLDDAGEPELLRAEFERRYRGNEPDEDWDGYLSGVYGVCLREVTPETITRKGRLVARIEAMLAAPRPHDAGWLARLRAAVDELDALERPFSPDYDRTRFGRPPSRDTLISAPRRRYSELWAAVTQEA